MAEKIPEFFRYARDIAAIQFAGYQRNDFAISKRDWELQQSAESQFHEPGRFVAIPGYEWSPPTHLGGDHNVFFRRHDQPVRRSSHELVADRSDVEGDLPRNEDLYAAFRHSDTVIIPHVGGEHSDLAHHDPSLEPAIEVTSTHGTFEWFLREALEYRYRVGFLGGSDSCTGRPGDDRPGFQRRRYAKAGLAGVYGVGGQRAVHSGSPEGPSLLRHDGCQNRREHGGGRLRDGLRVQNGEGSADLGPCTGYGDPRVGGAVPGTREDLQPPPGCANIDETSQNPLGGGQSEALLLRVDLGWERRPVAG
jgi:hypothetical protein